MGYRMNIWPEGREEESVGDDHKFYGYTDYKKVKQSFDYLFYTTLSLDKDFEGYLELKDPPMEAYSAFCAIGCSPEMVLTSDEFEEFTKLYLRDLGTSRPYLTPEWFSEISGYMHKMCKIPGNKVLQWF